VLDLRAGERRLGLNALITRDPARLVRRARGRAISGPSPAWGWLSASKPYRMIRPWLLWRVLRRHVDVLRVAEADHVIIVHQDSWPIAGPVGPRGGSRRWSMVDPVHRDQQSNTLRTDVSVAQTLNVTLPVPYNYRTCMGAGRRLDHGGDGLMRSLDVADETPNLRAAATMSRRVARA
jgi:hypothetical protein